MRAAFAGALLVFALTTTTGAAEEPYLYSAQVLAFTSNAGGQRVYGLRLTTPGQTEWALFANELLRTGPTPLSGGGVTQLFGDCLLGCFFRYRSGIGGGLSTAGPYAEFLWGLHLAWALRLDFATHVYFSAERVLTWNYPAWLGLSLSF